MKKTGPKPTKIKITPEIRAEIESFKKRLIQMANEPDETSQFDVATINMIIKDLSAYDRNILIAYYAVANCSSTALGKMLGVSNATIACRIKSIINKLKKNNVTIRTLHNSPRSPYYSE